MTFLLPRRPRTDTDRAPLLRRHPWATTAGAVATVAATGLVIWLTRRHRRNAR